jgi:hypothetical protein
MISKEIISAVFEDIETAAGERNIDKFSSTRDIFTARIQTYVSETDKWLESAIIGEIGNNTFDHNYEYAENYPRGVFCDLNYRGKFVVLADFGRGIRASLSQVIAVKTDKEALETAFTRRISGRSPEQRGSGLKFVHETISENGWELYFQSGTGCCQIYNAVMNFYESEISVTGCLAILQFSKDN